MALKAETGNAKSAIHIINSKIFRTARYLLLSCVVYSNMTYPKMQGRNIHYNNEYTIANSAMVVRYGVGKAVQNGEGFSAVEKTEQTRINGAKCRNLGGM